MAFSVTPASGEAPYVLAANISNSELIDGIKYAVSVGYSTSVGSCPSVGASNFLIPTQITTLLATGSVSSLVEVPSGSCRTYTLKILDIANGVDIDSSSVYVNNV